jgi:hypothetical protein
VGEGDLFDPSVLPAPDVLRRRHLALVLIDEALAGPDGGFRCFETDGTGELLTFSNGSGDEYQLSLTTDSRAVLALFDHESPYSPWAHPSCPLDWPGMLSGFPGDLSGHLPRAEDPGSPRSITACYWFAGERWNMGTPDPAPDAGESGDPQGVATLLAPTLDPSGGEAGRYVGEFWERPEAVDPAMALFVAIDRGEPVRDSQLRALGVRDASALLGQARQRRL